MSMANEGVSAPDTQLQKGKGQPAPSESKLGPQPPPTRAFSSGDLFGSSLTQKTSLSSSMIVKPNTKVATEEKSKKEEDALTVDP